MSVEEARRDYEDAARESAFYAAACARDFDVATCASCGVLSLDVDAQSIALDLAVAEHVSGRRTDGAALARREGLGWA